MQKANVSQRTTHSSALDVTPLVYVIKNGDPEFMHGNIPPRAKNWMDNRVQCEDFG